MDPLIVPGKLDQLALLAKYVMTATTVANLDKKVAYRLRLAVDEIATNSIIHGYDEAGKQGDLKIQAIIDDTSLKIILEDMGDQFDPRQIPPPASLDLPVEEREIGGLGVYLSLKGVDEFNYEWVDGCNRNIFIMHRK